MQISEELKRQQNAFILNESRKRRTQNRQCQEKKLENIFFSRISCSQIRCSTRVGVMKITRGGSLTF